MGRWTVLTSAPSPSKRLSAASHPLVHDRLALRPLEAFREAGDSEAAHAALQGRHVVGRIDIGLARIDAVGPGHRLEQPRHVLQVGRHWPGVIEGELDGGDARVRHEAEGGLHAVEAAPRGRDAQRATLIGAHGHVDRARRDQRGAAARRAAGGVARLVRVGDQPGGRREARALHAEGAAHGLAGDRAAGIEDAGDDGGVDLRHVAFQHRGADRHRHAGEADVVLQRHGLACEQPVARAAHLAAPIPGVVGVLLRRRAVARRARIGDRQAGLGQCVDPGIGPDAFGDQLPVGRRQSRRQPYAEFGGDGDEFVDARRPHARKARHRGSSLSPPAARRRGTGGARGACLPR